MGRDRTSRTAPRLAMVTLLIWVAILTPGVGHADAVRDRQWHLDFLDVVKAHEITKGEGVTVAVLDSGVDHHHPDLKGVLLAGRNFSEGRGDGWQDATGHGTAMAALIAARGHGPHHRDGVLGVAPDSRILPVRTENAGFSDSRGLVQGLRWAADHGADVISVSLADFDVPELHEATEYALKQGAVVVAGVGNTAKGDDEVMSPARYPGVVAVSGTDQDGNFTEASVSGQQVVLSAPATDIVTGGSGNRGRYSIGTGTSNSTAIVAGVAALVKARYPRLDAANVINRLIVTAEDRGPRGRDRQYGYGIVNPLAALTEQVAGVAANPLIAPPSSPGAGATGRTPATGSEVSPTSWGLITLGAVGVLGVATATLPSLVRRRRRRVCGPATGHPTSGPQQRIRTPTPPGGSGPG